MTSTVLLHIRKQDLNELPTLGESKDSLTTFEFVIKSIKLAHNLLNSLEERVNTEIGKNILKDCVEDKTFVER